MSLSINPALAEGNPLGLTQSELQMLQAWESMTDDQKGEHIHYAKEQDAIDRYVSSKELHDEMNSNTYQRLSGGGVQVVGALRPDAILTIDGVEMTAQQAVDIGARSSDSIGTPTADLI